MNEKVSVDEVMPRFQCDISSRLQELVESPLQLSEAGVSGYEESVLCRTEWVEILLLRSVEEPEILRIEVEVLVPVAAQPGAHLVPQDIMRLNMVAHMKYLMKLLDIGFSLQVVGEECLWVATGQFTGIPNPEVVHALAPPQAR